MHQLLALCAALSLGTACRPTEEASAAPRPSASAPAPQPAPESVPVSAPASAPALPEISFVESLIPYGADREALTVEYIRDHYDPSASDSTIDPRMIIIHWTGGNSVKGTLATFRNLRIEEGRKSVKKAGDLNVSSHFVIDRDGTIYRLVPETKMARHCIGLNRVAIGVENVGGPENPLTPAQRKANADLVRYLAAKFPKIEYLIGHLEYRAFDGHPLFQERDPTYRNAKPDPGPAFMKQLRSDLSDLPLQGPPPAKK
jgi:N-acetylmuramoyl-L-alanine amidase